MAHRPPSDPKRMVPKQPARGKVLTIAEWHKLSEDEQQDKRKEDAFKTVLCDAFRRTFNCPDGLYCTNAHSQNELRLPTQPRGPMHPEHMTRLCEMFERNGECKYGSDCMFIHRGVGGKKSNVKLSSCGYEELSGDSSFEEISTNRSTAVQPASFSSLDSSRATDKTEAARPTVPTKTVESCKITDEEWELLLNYRRRKDGFKTLLCDAAAWNEDCPYGDKCRFAHWQDELRVPTERRGPTHPMYKRKLCEKFERNAAACKKGNACMDIHRGEGGKGVEPIIDLTKR